MVGVMAPKPRNLLICNCEVTMPLDGRALGQALGREDAVPIHTQLCIAQLERFKTAVRAGTPVVVGCTQEAPRFEEVRAELEPETETETDSAPEIDIAYVNIRERAGWSEAGGEALPKIAALLAEAQLDLPPTPSITLESGGECLVYGAGQAVLDAALQLAPRLPVTLVLTGDTADLLPPERLELPIFKGRVAITSGHLGAFALVFEHLAPLEVSSRQGLSFGRPQADVALEADLILDLSGGAPLLPAAAKRDGYVRPDPADPAAVQRALFDLTDLVGDFEKPRYVDFSAELCAHGRSRKTGCTRCLEVCPAAAITSAGDVVAIDPHICGGCGGCHAVCPTGAASYAFPPATALLERLRTLLSTYRKAGGEHPVLLVHDEAHGTPLIAALARFGRGLPANVIPFAVNEVTQLGLEAVLGAFAYGTSRLLFLLPPGRMGETLGLEQQQGIMAAILDGLGYKGERFSLLAETDPSALEEILWNPNEPESQADRGFQPMPAGDFLPMGQKRALMRLALDSLQQQAPLRPETIALPEGAPFGGLEIDTEGCTLCLACVGACPTGALLDNPDRPQLRFQEEACVQCGLCVATCPESVIALAPRVSFLAGAREALVVKEEEPFDCVRCGKPFGTKSSIERIVAMLAEKHAMFQDSAAIDRIRMCEDCRVIVQF
jgi:ferredoxin